MKYNINSQLEIDFIIQCGGRIIPTEVKAEENVKSKSLKTFVQVQYPNLKGLRISMKQYVDQDGWKISHFRWWSRIFRIVQNLKNFLGV